MNLTLAAAGAALASARLALRATSHAVWWLDWQTRSAPAAAARFLGSATDEEPSEASLRHLAA